MRERLIELVKDSLFRHIDKSCKLAENITYDLLANGVIVPPISLGRSCWVIPTAQNGLKEITEMRCIGYSMGDIGTNDNIIDWKNKLFKPNFSDFGKTVFLTKEEAEQALAEKGGANQ